jgi:hypothetical protein
MSFLVRQQIRIFENALQLWSTHFWFSSTQTGIGERLCSLHIVVSSLGEDAIDDFLQLKGYTHDELFALGNPDNYLADFAFAGLHVCRYRSSGQSVDVMIAEACCYDPELSGMLRTTLHHQ